MNPKITKLENLRAEYRESLLAYRAKPNPSAYEKLRILAVRIRAAKKPILLAISTVQAYAAKARLILDGKGKNGRSMNPELLERHMACR